MDNIKNFIGNVITPTNKTSLQTNSSTGGNVAGRKRSESLCSNASDVSSVSMNSDGRKMERKDSKDNEPYFYIMWHWGRRHKTKFQIADEKTNQSYKKKNDFHHCHNSDLDIFGLGCIRVSVQSNIVHN
jgi:hypothetical protein